MSFCDTTIHIHIEKSDEFIIIQAIVFVELQYWHIVSGFR